MHLPLYLLSSSLLLSPLIDNTTSAAKFFYHASCASKIEVLVYKLFTLVTLRLVFEVALVHFLQLRLHVANNRHNVVTDGLVYLVHKKQYLHDVV